MIRTLKLPVFAAVTLAGLAGQVRAEQIFDFSFTNTIGNVPGSVTGEIVLPFDGDGTGAASKVLLKTFPSALSSIGAPPVDTTLWTYQELNAFTVLAGHVTGASQFYAYTSTSYPSSVIDLTITTSYLAYGPGPLVHGTNTEVYSDATTFTPASSPEPASLTLLGTAILAFGGFRFCRAKKGKRRASLSSLRRLLVSAPSLPRLDRDLGSRRKQKAPDSFRGFGMAPARKACRGRLLGGILAMLANGRYWTRTSDLHDVNVAL